MKVAIVYWSGTGNTEAMSEEIAIGARDAGAEVLLETVADVDAVTIGAYDRIVLGCPAMGIEELEEFEVEPFFEALTPFLQDKEIGIFGSCGWSAGEWLDRWARRIDEKGGRFLQAPLRCTGYPDEDALKSCREFGMIMGTQYTEDK